MLDFAARTECPADDLTRTLSDLAKDQIENLLFNWEVWARDDQLPPPGTEWRTWLILGGRGAGKTRAGAEWVRAQALGRPPFATRPAERIALVAETYHDARAVMVEGISGLLKIHAPDERPEFFASRGELVWPNGAIGQIVSAEDPDGLRGPQFDAAWCDEIYLQRYWRPSFANELPPSIGFMHFDASVNHGLTGAAHILQNALKRQSPRLDVDGEIGPLTLAAAAAADERRLLADYATTRRARYRALPHFWKFGRGWLNRVDQTEAKARALVEPAERPASSPLASSPEKQPKGTTMTTSPDTPATGKLWVNSMTIWGALLTAVSTVVPVLGPAFGIDLTPDLVREAGEQLIAVIQAIGGLIGTIMTILGRARANQTLAFRAA